MHKGKTNQTSLPITATACDIKGCSHGCNSHNGIATCYCPTDKKYLLEDETECVEDTDFVQVDTCLSLCPLDDEEPSEATIVDTRCADKACSHGCHIDDQTDQAVCSCPVDAKYNLDSETTCVENYEYCDDNDGASSPACTEDDENALDCSACSHGCYIDDETGLTTCSCPVSITEQYDLIDETACQVRTDGCDTKGCSHACYVANGLARCACPKGWDFVEDSDTECELPERHPCYDSLCKETCYVSNGIATCACPEGKDLDPTDGLTCIDNVIVFAAQDPYGTSEDTFIRAHDLWMDAKRSNCFEIVPKFGEGSTYFDRGAMVQQTHCNQYDDHQKFTFNKDTGVIGIIGNTERCIGFKMMTPWLQGDLPGPNRITHITIGFEICDQNEPGLGFKWKWEYEEGIIWSDDGEWCLVVRVWGVNFNFCRYPIQYLDRKSVV